MVITLLVLVGLVLGSFVNAVVWRLHEQNERARHKIRKGAKSTLASQNRDLSIVTGRSMCTHCGHQLEVLDLVPVFSYLWLRGKCRYCGRPIEDTPVAELVVPILLVMLYLWWPFGFAGVWSIGNVLFYFWVALVVGFVILSIYDIRWFLLPDRVVFPVIALAAAYVATQALVFGGGWTTIVDAFWGVVAIAGTFWLLYTFSKGKWIGFGDVKLAIALGMLVGGPVASLLVIFVASLLGSLAALPLVIKGRARGTTPIPFGPFLMAATVVVMLFGPIIIDWYGRLLRVG